MSKNLMQRKQMFSIKRVSIICLFLLSPLITFSQLRTSFDGVVGDVWLDTDGNPIQAHGGQVQKIGDKWWWIGEDKKDGYRTQNGISLYSSSDLYNWNFEGYVMRAIQKRSDLDTDSELANLYRDLSSSEKDAVYNAINTTTSVIERPKLIYNKKTNKYIIWFHADGPLAPGGASYAAAAAGIAIADNITGPYRFIERSRLHQLPSEDYGTQWYEAEANRGFARDMNLFTDDDGTGYIIYSSEENRTMFISRLNDEYTDLDVAQEPIGLAKNGVDFVRLYPGRQREAPAMFKYNGKYYMITSGATGWDPNRAEYWVADDILGEWKVMGDPCVSQSGILHPSSLTFRTQSTNVIPYDPENGRFIYMGDRWDKNNLQDSRYVWLPVTITPTGDIKLYSIENWDLNYFNNINDMRFTENQFAKMYFRSKDIPQKMEIDVNENNVWKKEYVDINWQETTAINIEQLPPASLTSINGNFFYKNETYPVSVKGVNVPEDLYYFIDCGALEGSYLMDSIMTKGLAPNLVNKNICDAPFSEERTWGYTGLVGTKESGADIDYKNPSSKDAFVSGWFAWANKPIDYKLQVKNDRTYRLTLGFQEWWSTGRNMRTVLYYKDVAGDNVERELGKFNNSKESTQDYLFNVTNLNREEPYITISVEKTGNPDPILSWLALTDTGDGSGMFEDTESGEDQLNVYPNPISVGEAVTIDVSHDQLSDGNVFIYNTSGKIIKQYKMRESRESLEISLLQGIYVVKACGKHAKLIVK